MFHRNPHAQRNDHKTILIKKTGLKQHCSKTYERTEKPRPKVVLRYASVNLSIKPSAPIGSLNLTIKRLELRDASRSVIVFCPFPPPHTGRILTVCYLEIKLKSMF